MKLAIRQSIQASREIATSRLVHLFAAKFGFVYFQQLDSRVEPHHFVGGLTASPQQKDQHYIIGHFRGFDLTAVERRSTLTYPGRAPQTYKWLALQIDMATKKLPHVFLATHNHSSLFYADLLARYPYLQKADHLLIYHEPLFTKHFRIFAAAADFPNLTRLITPAMATMLGYHFRKFDYEIDGSHLRIYAVNTPISPVTLQEMLRVGIWLAEQLSI